MTCKGRNPKSELNTFQIIIPLSNCKPASLNKLIIKLMLTIEFNMKNSQKIYCNLIIA